MLTVRLYGTGLSTGSTQLARVGLYNFGALSQRLLWGSIGTVDPQALVILYLKTLAAPFTVNAMLEGALKTLTSHAEMGRIKATDGRD